MFGVCVGDLVIFSWAGFYGGGSRAGGNLRGVLVSASDPCAGARQGHADNVRRAGGWGGAHPRRPAVGEYRRRSYTSFLPIPGVEDHPKVSAFLFLLIKYVLF